MPQTSKSPSLRALLAPFARVALAGVTGGVVYTAWLAILLLVWNRGGGDVLGVLSAFAPLVTALGFGFGVWTGDRAFRLGRPGIWESVKWPLAGCVFGAVVLYPFGYRLVVFGMLSMGTVAVAIREWRRVARPREEGR